MTIQFPLATSSWQKEELDAMHEVINSGMFTMGAKVSEFEQKFASYCGSKHCIMVNSGSSANLLMIAALFYTKNSALRLKRGDEVIVPAVSWSTTYYPLYQYGLKIKFVDIDLETLNFDLTQLSEAITDNTRVILAVNLLGNPNDFDAIKKIINSREIILLEDNCEAMGAEFNNKKTGTFGVIGTFSTFFSHHISTMEGGLIATDNNELYHILLSLRSHGWTRNLPKENYVTKVKSDDSFEESFKFVLPGYNVRPIELEGAIGIEQLKRLPEMIKERRKNADLLKKFFSNNKYILIQKEIGKSSWFGFSLILKHNCPLTRVELLKILQSKGFECRPIVGGNFAKNEVVKYFNSTTHGSLYNANYIDKNGFFIGNHHYPIPEAFNELAKIRFLNN